MKRALLDTLMQWKESPDRQPIMLDGARQVGKSYLIEHLFGANHFDKVFKINFEDTIAAANLFVGGMPAAVKKWFTSPAPIIQKTRQVRKIQNDLITGYIRDFGKYDAKNKFLAAQLEAVFRNIPKQLSQSVDTSVKRFKFNQIIQGKNRYRDFQTLINCVVSLAVQEKIKYTPEHFITPVMRPNHC